MLNFNIDESTLKPPLSLSVDRKEVHFNEDYQGFYKDKMILIEYFTDDIIKEEDRYTSWAMDIIQAKKDVTPPKKRPVFISNPSKDIIVDEPTKRRIKFTNTQRESNYNNALTGLMNNRTRSSLPSNQGELLKTSSMEELAYNYKADEGEVGILQSRYNQAKEALLDNPPPAPINKPDKLKLEVKDHTDSKFRKSFIASIVSSYNLWVSKESFTEEDSHLRHVFKQCLNDFVLPKSCLEIALGRNIGEDQVVYGVVNMTPLDVGVTIGGEADIVPSLHRTHSNFPNLNVVNGVRQEILVSEESMLGELTYGLYIIQAEHIDGHIDNGDIISDKHIDGISKEDLYKCIVYYADVDQVISKNDRRYVKHTIAQLDKPIIISPAHIRDCETEQHATIGDKVLNSCPNIDIYSIQGEDIKKLSYTILQGKQPGVYEKTLDGWECVLEGHCLQNKTILREKGLFLNKEDALSKLKLIKEAATIIEKENHTKLVTASMKAKQDNVSVIIKIVGLVTSLVTLLAKISFPPNAIPKLGIVPTVGAVIVAAIILLPKILTGIWNFFKNLFGRKESRMATT